jgi:hypothetical protein
LKTKQPYSPLFFLSITAAYAVLGYCIGQLEINEKPLIDNAMFVGGICGTPTLVGSVQTMASFLLQDKNSPLFNRSFSNQNERVDTIESVALTLNITIYDDSSIKDLIEQFEFKKIELKQLIALDQSRRLTFFQWLFDKKDSNLSSLRALNQKELFDENLSTELLEYI